MESYKTIAQAIDRASDLTADEKTVLSFIVCRAYVENSRSPVLGDEEIAAAAGISADRIEGITSSLVRKGYLTKEGIE